MLCSNEVVLHNIYNAVKVESDKFIDIDILNIDLYKQENRLVYTNRTSISSRIYKIIDILSYNGYSKLTNLSVLIERADGERLICRASDLIYMKNVNYHPLTTIEKKIVGDDYRYVLKLLNLEFEKSNEYVIDAIHQELASNEHFLWKTMESDVELVDKNDSRLRCNNRFYLKSHYRGLLTRLINSRASYKDYHLCSSCNKIGIESFRKFDNDYYCNICYDKIEDSCDICHIQHKITQIIDIAHIDSDFVRQIAKNINCNKICDYCINIFYVDCKRCKSVEIININKLRNCMGYQERRDLIEKFLPPNNDNYTSIFGSRYCTDCGSQLLSNYLFNPFAHKGLPNKFSSNPTLNRFTGIESEVITNYDGAEDYYNCALVPKYFDVVEDGSLSSGGVEFVTRKPIIGNDIIESCTQLEEAHYQEGNMVDSSCGVHIHMNAVDFNFTEIKSLLMIMSKIQSSIYKSLPKERLGSSYCKPIDINPRTIDKIESLSKLVEGYYKMGHTNISDSKYNDARYIGTNIHARFMLGTIEFRYHEGTTSSEEIVNWVRFLNRIMNKSKSLIKNKELYRKIINKKTNPMDVIRDIAGTWGTEYIESRIDKQK